VNAAGLFAGQAELSKLELPDKVTPFAITSLQLAVCVVLPW
jgi:hypothetical protein